jgi:CPA1 family monovalent cation:H+ antiporter
LTPLSNRYTEKIPLAWQHVLVWGGLHGSVSIALALSLPATLEHRSLLLTTTLGVVAFSIIVQGMTMRPLLDWLKLSGEGKGDYGRWKAKQLALSAARRELELLRQEKLIGPGAHTKLLQSVDSTSSQIEENLAKLEQDDPKLVEQDTRAAKLRMLNAERSAIQRAVMDGFISAHAAEELLTEAAERIDEISHEGH